MVSQQVFEASKHGDISYLKSLEANHLTDKLVDEHGANCCHYAARGGSVDVLAYLVENKGFDPLKRSKVGSTAVHDAAAAGKLYTLKWLLQHSKPTEDDQDGTGATILHLASRFGHTAVAEWILDNTPCDIMKKSASGSLPIHFAVVSGNLDTVKVLFKEAPRSINLQTMNGVTPMYLAAQGGHLEILKFLAEKGSIAKINCYDGMTCLHAAAQFGHLDSVQFLVTDQKCNPNERDFDGATALHFAASNGHTKVVEWLLQAGNAKVTLDNLGGSPLHNAAEMGKIKVVKTLLQNGCSPDITDNNGLTAADLAEKCWHENCAKEIKAKGGIRNSPELNFQPESPTSKQLYNFQLSSLSPSSRLTDSEESLTNSGPCSQSEETGECESTISVPVTCTKSRETGECEGRRLANTELSSPTLELGYTHRQRASSDLSSAVSSLSSFSHQTFEDIYTGIRQGFPLRPISLQTFSYQPIKDNSQSDHHFQIKRFTKMNNNSKAENPNRDDTIMNGSQNRPQNEDEDGTESVASSDSLDHEISRLNLRGDMPPPLITPDMLNVAINKRPKSSTLDFRQPTGMTLGLGSRPSSTMSSPTQPNHDLIAELKKTTSAPNLKKTKKPNEGGQMTCIYSFGGPGGAQKNRTQPVYNKEQINGNTDIPQTNTILPKQNSDLPSNTSNSNTVTTKSVEQKTTTSIKDSKSFIDKIPATDASGNAVPLWRQQMLARQMAEKAQKETEEKKKQEEIEARFKDMPPWKRQLIEKKEAEAKGVHEKAEQSKKKVESSSSSGKKAPWVVEVQSLKS